MNSRSIKKTPGEIVFDVIVYAIAALFCIYCLYPFASFTYSGVRYP